jgi:hypothetical protein
MLLTLICTLHSNSYSIPASAFFPSLSQAFNFKFLQDEKNRKTDHPAGRLLRYAGVEIDRADIFSAALL